MASRTEAATVAPAAGITDGVIGTVSALGNPARAAECIRKRWFWIYPFIVFTVVTEIVQMATAPQRFRVIQAGMEQRGLTGEQMQTQLAMAAKFAPVGYVITPVMLLVVIAIGALLILGMASVLGKKGTFGQFMGLSAASTMPVVLQMIIGIFLVRSKPLDEIQSAADLQPPFGLNILVQNAPKALQGLLGFFSVFEIWAIVMAALMFAALCRTSAGKGFIATAPTWIVGALVTMLFSLFT